MGKKSYESLNRLMYNYGCTGIHARSASSGEPFVSTGEVSYFKMQGFHRDCTPEQLENLKPRPRKKGKPEAIDGRDPNSKGDASDVGGCEKPSDEGLVENPGESVARVVVGGLAGGWVAVDGFIFLKFAL